MPFQIPAMRQGAFPFLWSYATYTGTGYILDTANKRLSIIFTTTSTNAITGFVAWWGAATGTITNGCTADLYAVDANGVLTGGSLATVTFTPGSSSLLTTTFVSPYTPAANTTYTIVFKNVLGTPASNNFRLITNSYVSTPNMGVVTYPTYTGNSPDATNWFITPGAVTCVPTFSGLSTQAPMGPLGTNSQTAVSLYSTNGSRQARCAVTWNCPVPVYLHSIGWVNNSNTGSPTFTYYGEVCSANASLSVSDGGVNAVVAASVTPFCHWSTPFRLEANTTYYLGITSGAGTFGDASNLVRPMCGVNVVKPATVGPLIDTFTSTAWGGPSWSQLASYMGYVIPTVEIARDFYGNRGILTGGRR